MTSAKTHERQVVRHKYQINAELDNNEIVIEVSDSITNKTWRVIYNQEDYQDIEAEFATMKNAIDVGQIGISYPAKDGGNLELTADEYGFSLEQII